MTTTHRLRRIWVRFGGIVAALAALSSPAMALTTYSYSAPWSYWANSWGAANWASYAGLTHGLTFEFTTNAPLVNQTCGANPYACQVDVRTEVLSWHYNGGSSFLNIGSDVVGSTLNGLLISTDATGGILEGRFYVGGPVVIPTLEHETSSLSNAHDGYDQQLLQSTYLRQYSTGYYGQPLYGSLSEGMSNMRGAGQWSVATSVSAVPEPETYSLMLMGLGLMGVISRRRSPRTDRKET